MKESINIFVLKFRTNLSSSRCTRHWSGSLDLGLSNCKVISSVRINLYLYQNQKYLESNFHAYHSVTDKLCLPMLIKVETSLGEI